MDNPALIDGYKDELAALVARMQTDGLLPGTISFLLNEVLKACRLQEYVTDWLQVYTGNPWQGQRA